MSERIDTFIEVKIASQTDVDPLTHIVRAAHQANNLEFPINGPWIRNQVEQTRILKERAGIEKAIRKDVAENAERIYGPQSDEAISLAIFRDIASPLDAIYLSQRETYKGEALSWNEINNTTCVELRNTISRILDTPRFTKFLNVCQPFKETLKLIVDKLINENNPINLQQLQKDFLSLATAASKQMGPILLLILDQNTTNPSAENVSQAPRLLEARAQLIFPLDSENKQNRDDIVNAAFEQHSALHPMIHIDKPSFIIGTAAGWAGQELISYTTGERFEPQEGFMFAPNLIKEPDTYDKTLAFAAIPSSSYVNYAIQQYNITHEVGHMYGSTEDKTLTELDTDIPSVISCLKSAYQNNSLTNYDKAATMTAVLAAEFGKQVLAPYEGGETERGYYNSSYFILNSMFEHGLLAFSPDQTKLVITTSPDVFLTYTKYLEETYVKFLNQDHRTLEHLKQGNASSDTFRYIEKLR